MYNLEDLRTEMKRRAGPKRMLHIVAVEQEADALAQRWGVDREKARRAALLHDVTKQMVYSEQLKMCEKYDIVTTAMERAEHKLLHAVTGAAVARCDFGADEDIVSAVRWHTTGRPRMAPLEKIIYLADFVDATRRFPERPALRALCYDNLDAALLLGLDISIRLLLGEGRPICPATLDARNDLLVKT